MYTIVKSIRAIHKSFDLSIDLWDAIIERIVHTWNRIVISTISRKIISFEIVNDVQSNVSHLRVLECHFYVHVSKIFMRHKFDDKSWKEILVEYDETNQWKIYNFKTKRIHLSRDVRFDEKHNYYSNEGLETSECFEDEFDEKNVVEFWTKKNDEKLEKLQKKHVSMKADSTSRYSTSSSKLSDDVAEEKKKFQNATEDDRQQTSLSKNSMSRSVMSSSSVSKRSRNLILDDIFDRNAATDAAKSSTSFSSNFSSVSEDESNIDLRSKVTVKRRNKSSSSSSSSHRETRSSRKDDDRSNCRDLHEEINFVNFKSYSHMNRVLVALSIDDNLELDFSHIFKSRFYKKTRKSNEWSHWQKVIKIEIQFSMKNEIWELTKLSNDRKIIIDRWVFKVKYGLNDSILRYKARWVVHEYKQMKDVDFSSIWVEVVKSISFRTLFVIATARNLHILQLNIVTIFLYDQLDEDIYVNQSDDFIENLTLVYHLRKILYDLKQTSRV